MATSNQTNSGAKYSHLITNGSDEEREIPDVFRKMDGFPNGHHCDVSITDIPDSEDEFEKTDHYVQRKSERRNPAVTDEILTTVLTAGVVNKVTPQSHPDDRYLVQKECDGVEWTLVIASTGSLSDTEWVLNTVFLNYHGSTGTTNKYLDRLRERRGDDE